MSEDLMSREMRKFMSGDSVQSEEVDTEEMGEDVMLDNESEEPNAEELSIKERIESGATPQNPQAKKMKKQVKKDIFDLGGWDERNRRQLERERGFGMGMGIDFMGGRPREKLNYAQRTERQLLEADIRAGKERTRLELAERRLALAQARMSISEQAQQARQKQKSIDMFNRSITENINKERYAAGLPVYENPVDYLIGGKVRKVSYDEKGNKVEELSRYGGLFGAAEEGYKFAKKAAPKLKYALQENEKAMKKVGEGAVSLPFVTASKIQAKAQEFASDEKGVFQVAKSTGGKVAKTVNIGVGSYYDNSDIGRAMDSLLERKPGNKFIDSMFMTNPKEREKHTLMNITPVKQAVIPMGTPSYEGRNLNPEKVTPNPFTYIPNEEKKEEKKE